MEEKERERRVKEQLAINSGKTQEDPLKSDQHEVTHEIPSTEKKN